MSSSTPTEGDIGPYDTLQPGKLVRGKLMSHEKQKLDRVNRIIGSKQVTEYHMEGIAPWVLQNSLKDEHEGN